VAAALVLALAVLAWVGWATGIQELTRINPSWPPMKPWTVVWLAALAMAILVQSGRPSPVQVWIARGLAAIVAVITAVVLTEYATGRSFGVDSVWFGEAVRRIQPTLPGRPSPQTVSSVFLLSVPVALNQVNRCWTRMVGAGCLVAAMAMPFFTILAYLFGAVAELQIASSTGMALTTAVGMLLLGAAMALSRPAELIARSDRLSLIRLGMIFAGFPLLVGLSRRALLALGLREDLALTFSTAIGTVVLGAAAYRLSRREHELVETIDSDRNLLRASMDAMINPQVLIEAVREPGGKVVDFFYRNANRATLSSLGLSEEELIGASALKTLPRRDGPGLLPRLAQCLEDGQPVSLDDFPYFNKMLDEVRRYDIRANRAGTDLLAMSWSDVTERFRYVERIAESEERYRLLAENVGDVVCRLRDDTIVWVSKSVEHVLGAPPAHWIGRKAADFVVAEDQADHRNRVDELAHGGTVMGRARVLAADGTEHWVHMLVKPFIDADGKPDGALSSFRLIDNEVAAEQAVEEARRAQARADERFRRTINNAAVGMCLVTPDGRLHEVNDAMGRLFGLDAETMNGMYWQEFTAQEYLDEELEDFNAVLEGRIDGYRMIKHYTHADGHPVLGDLSVSCLRLPDGGVEMFIAQITDITALMEANEQNRILAQQLQRQSDKLQQQTDRLTAELESAASYMSSIMPTGLTGEVSVSSRYLPSRELGGDSFDYTWIDDDHLLVYLIDVSGHGLEPALLTVSLHNMLRSGSLAPETLLMPDEVLGELNRRFQMDQQGYHYFTMWCGVYEVSSRTLRYSSAGAPPAFAFNSATGGQVEVTELSTRSTPVGMFEDTEFTSRSYAVPAGCRILVYSDGASEITLADERQLSLAGFKDLTSRLAHAPDCTLDELIDELNALSPLRAFEDDCSLILLKFD
ncbi:MAG: PAS domain S-box protein, partial [Mycobacterium sp.]